MINLLLDPPEIRDCKLQYFNGSPISVSNNIDVKEFSSFSITCSVNSKPEATKSWLGPITLSTKTLNVNRVNRQHKGTYTIFATNRMEPTFGEIKRGNNTKSLSFNILCTYISYYIIEHLYLPNSHMFRYSKQIFD
jgi:hypothetical protein